MSDDTLRQIEAVLSLAESDTELSDAEKVNLLASTGRKLLQAMATERKRAEAAEDELARQSAYSTQLEQDRDVSVSRFKRILDEQQALRESIATLESQLANANGRAQILAAQLGGWEAACASQVKAARIYLDATADMAHNGPQIAARGRLANAIDSNAGQFLLSPMRSSRSTRCAARLSSTRRVGSTWPPRPTGSASRWQPIAKRRKRGGSDQNHDLRRLPAPRRPAEARGRSPQGAGVD
jgi:hypothetical protein